MEGGREGGREEVREERGRGRLAVPEVVLSAFHVQVAYRRPRTQGGHGTLSGAAPQYPSVQHHTNQWPVRGGGREGEGERERGERS